MAILPGTRIRDNGVFGTTTDNPLTAGAVTFNSANLALLSVVAGNHALVTLDPLRQFGAPEIVMVTAHTAAATVATIQRGMFGTVARQHPQGTLWVHAATDNDFIEVVTSGTRPSDQYEGQAIYETDTEFYMGFNGSTWGKIGSALDTSPYSNHFLANPPACRITRTAAQSIGDNVEVLILFDTERFDTDSMHSTSSLTSRITFNTAGIYLVSFNGLLAAGSDYDNAYAAIRLNGTTILAYGTGEREISSPLLQVHTLYKFVATDYVEILVYQDNTAGAARNLDKINNASPEFSAVWVGLG